MSNCVVLVRWQDNVKTSEWFSFNWTGNWKEDGWGLHWMSLHRLSKAELICWSFHSLILIEIFEVFLSHSPHILFAPPFPAIAIECFLVPLLCLFLWCSSPTLLGSCHSLLSSFFRFLQHAVIFSWKLSWCVYSSSFFQLHLLMIKNVFGSLFFSLSLSLLPICVLWSDTLSHFDWFPAWFLTFLPLQQGTCKTVWSYFFTCLQGNTGQFSDSLTHKGAHRQKQTYTHTLSICSTDRL